VADLEWAKAKANQLIDDRIAKTQAETQARVNDVTMQMHQRIEALKQKAGRRISQERAIVAKLERTTSGSRGIIGRIRRRAPRDILGRGPIYSGRANCHQVCAALERPLSANRGRSRV
jgi:hypothetical protein